MLGSIAQDTWINNYLPSSSEKKQAVLMYMFVGLLLSLQQENISPYMHHHIKQAFGRVVLLVLVIFLDIILFILGAVFGVFFSILGLLVTIPVLTMGILCIKQARDGKYQRNSEGALKFFSAFSGLWNRVLNLFDADHYKTKNTVAGIDLSQYDLNK